MTIVIQLNGIFNRISFDRNGSLEKIKLRTRDTCYTFASLVEVLSSIASFRIANKVREIKNEKEQYMSVCVASIV